MFNNLTPLQVVIDRGWNNTAQLQFATQFGEFTVSALKHRCLRWRRIVIDKGSELCDICTQSDVLGAPLHADFRAFACANWAMALMVAKRLENRNVIR